MKNLADLFYLDPRKRTKAAKKGKKIRREGQFQEVARADEHG